MIQQELVKQNNKQHCRWVKHLIGPDPELDDWAEQTTQSYLWVSFLIVDNNDIRWAQVTRPGGHQPLSATCHRSREDCRQLLSGCKCLLIGWNDWQNQLIFYSSVSRQYQTPSGCSNNLIKIRMNQHIDQTILSSPLFDSCHMLLGDIHRISFGLDC